jgi:hypothetical protein
MSYRKETIPSRPEDITSKSEALNYCLLVCRKSLTLPGCAVECPIRKKWQIPPHGDHYYGE